WPALLSASHACGRGDPGCHGRPRGLYGHWYRRQAGLFRHVHHRRELRSAWRGACLADHLACARDGRRHDRALLCGCSYRRPRADRRYGADRTHDRPAAGRHHLHSARVRGSRALSADGAGAAGAAVRSVRRGPGEEDLMTGRFKPITAVAVIFFVVAALAALFVSSWATLFALILAKGIVVLGIVLLLQAGQVSFGHAMFFATGAYTAAFWGKYMGG